MLLKISLLLIRDRTTSVLIKSHVFAWHTNGIPVVKCYVPTPPPPTTELHSLPLHALFGHQFTHSMKMLFCSGCAVWGPPRSLYFMDILFYRKYTMWTIVGVLRQSIKYINVQMEINNIRYSVACSSVFSSYSTEQLGCSSI